MKHIGQTLLVAALMALASTAMAQAVPFSYECGCSKSVPVGTAVSPGCQLTENICALQTTSAYSCGCSALFPPPQQVQSACQAVENACVAGTPQDSPVLFSLLLGINRGQQVGIQLPTFVCQAGYPYLSGDVYCKDSNGPNGAVIQVNAKASGTLRLSPALTNDSAYDAQKAALTTYIAALNAQSNLVSSIAFDNTPYGYSGSAICGPATEASCKYFFNDTCNIKTHIDDLVAQFNTSANNANGLFAKIITGYPCSIKLNGVAATDSFAKNLKSLFVSLAMGAALSPQAVALESDPKFIQSGDGYVKDLLSKLSPYVQKWEVCTATTPVPSGYSACKNGVYFATTTPALKDNMTKANQSIMITTAKIDDNLKIAMTANQITAAQANLAVYKEVLSDAGIDLYFDEVAFVPSSSGGGDNNTVTVGSQCKSDAYDCKALVSLTSGTTGSADGGSKPAFIIDGGRRNQILWMNFDGTLAVFDPSDTQKALLCTSPYLMTGIGHNDDGTSKHVLLASLDASGAIKANSINLPAASVVQMLKKVIADKGVSTQDAISSATKAAACDVLKILADAGIKNTDMTPVAMMPSSDPNAKIVNGVDFLNGQWIMGYSDSKTNGLLRGIGILNSDMTLDYRALPNPVAMGDAEIVAAPLTDGTEVVAYSDNKNDASKSVAVRCVLPAAAGITCTTSKDVATYGDMRSRTAMRKVLANSKDDAFATQLFILTSPNSDFGKVMMMEASDIAPALKKQLDDSSAVLGFDTNQTTTLSQSLFLKHGYGEMIDSVIPTPAATLIIRKSDHGVFPQVAGTLPGATTCYSTTVSKRAGLVCIAPNGLYTIPVINRDPKCDHTENVGAGNGVQISPKCTFQVGDDYSDHTYQWTLEQKVGEQWNDITSLLDNPAAQNPIAAIPSSRTTSLKGAVDTSPDATGNALFRATGTVTNAGGGKAVVVSIFGSQAGTTETGLGGFVPKNSSAIGGGACSNSMMPGSSEMPNVMFAFLLLPFMILIPARVRATVRRK